MNFASFTLTELLTMQLALRRLKVTNPQIVVSSLLRWLNEEIVTRTHRIHNPQFLTAYESLDERTRSLHKPKEQQ